MHVWQPRDWFVYARAGVYLTCASIYCSFRLISPTAAIVQWARCSGFVFESRGGIITFYLFYLLCFLSHFSLYYLLLIQLTSISVIIRICWPYESSIAMRLRGYLADDFRLAGRGGSGSWSAASICWTSLVRRRHWETEHLPSPDRVSGTAFLLPSVIRHCSLSPSIFGKLLKTYLFV